MTAGLPEWDDDDALLQWIEANEYWVNSPAMDRNERQRERKARENTATDEEFEREATAMLAAEAEATLLLTGEERSALLGALEGAGTDRLKATCDVLRAGAASPGFLSAVAEMIELRLLHGPAKVPFGSRPPLPSGPQLRADQLMFATGLAALFGAKRRTDEYREKALGLLRRRHEREGWPAGAVERRMNNPGEKLPEERRAGYDLWRRVKAARAE